jgi:hypothetical protein
VPDPSIVRAVELNADFAPKRQSLMNSHRQTRWLDAESERLSLTGSEPFPTAAELSTLSTLSALSTASEPSRGRL